ncbi:MAG TPA: MarR family transcriptional regulator [Miltoncostaeaceae bacterium]|jgi:DNA-binding MarR family transcriptional regulator|nr:MarR family transcriptional regulator [Miltoncostaeaceae bacterium]
MPLDDGSVERLRVAVMRTARRLRAAAAEERLTPTQSGTLATLVREGPMRAGDLAAAEAVNPTMMSRILGHLEEAGLIERAPDQDDARSTVARATPAGRRLLGRLRTRRAAVLRERLDHLAPEHVAALKAALPALEALAEMDRAPA